MSRTNDQVVVHLLNVRNLVPKDSIKCWPDIVPVEAVGLAYV
jgi:hypothetical protein